MPGVGICFFGLPGLRKGDTWLTVGIVFVGLTNTLAIVGVEIFGGLPLRRTVDVAEDDPSQNYKKNICQFDYPNLFLN